MLVHGVPWQAALTQAFILSLVYFGVLLVATVLGFFGVLPLGTGLLLLLGFAILLVMIPLFMNLSRGFFTVLLGYLGLHVVVTIISYALHYMDSGVRSASSTSYAFRDSLYFSVATWTTSAYGDFLPTEPMRLVASLQTLTGVFTLAVAVALLWLWCSENLVPKEQAFMDGDKRHRTSLSVHRMRVWRLSGEKRDLEPEWIDPPPRGARMFWNPETRSWEEVEDQERLPDNALVVHRAE